jgi:hypothetical protein
MKIFRCNCKECYDNPICKFVNIMQRLPREYGGLGLCPRLKSGTDPHTYTNIDVPEERRNK